MDTLRFNDIEELCLIANESYEHHNEITFVCRYLDAKEILRELIYYDYTFRNIELENPEFGGYDDEYYISLYNDEIWCEKAKCGDKDDYLLAESDVVYISGECNSKILEKIDASEKIYEYHINTSDDEYDDFCDCSYDHKKCDCFLDDGNIHDGEIEVHTIKDGDDVHGFSLSKYKDGVYSSYSYYGSTVLDEDKVAKILKKIIF